MPASEVHLVLEDRDVTVIRINGKLVETSADGWFMDKSLQTVPIQAFLHLGKNVVEVHTDVTVVRSMEDIYLIGNFGVDVVSHTITREPDRLRVGDWSRQGYPFYADAMVYEAEVVLPKRIMGPVKIELPHFEGTVAAVWVNGKKAAIVGWRPYEADVTDFVKGGINLLGIEIVGSPRSLMGPRHSLQRYPVGVGPEEINDTREPSYQLSPAGLMGEVRVMQYRFVDGGKHRTTGRPTVK